MINGVNALDVMEAIRTRRTIGRVSERVPAKEVIDKILEAGNWAPSHYRTEPWRFIVLTGEGRDVLGNAYSDIALNTLNNPSSDEIRKAKKKGYQKARRAPVVIVMMMEPYQEDRVIWSEELSACSCAVQNMMLASHALGLGSIWRTGKPTYTDFMKKTFGVSNIGMVIGFLYIGYPAIEPKDVPRQPVEAKTEWWDTLDRASNKKS
jgi:nitroreductase